MDFSSSLSPRSTTIVPVAAAPTIQIVTKASSDQLLRKFADSNNKKKKKKTIVLSNLVTRPPNKRRESGDLCMERKSLLMPPATRKSSSSVIVMRKLGMGRRAFITKSIMGDIRKTLTRSVEKASRVFMEKQYNRHKRLINDVPAVQTPVNSVM